MPRLGALEIKLNDQTETLTAEDSASGRSMVRTFAKAPVGADGKLAISLSAIDGETYLNGIEIIRSGLQSTPVPQW